MSILDERLPSQAAPLETAPEGEVLRPTRSRRSEIRGFAWELVQTIPLTFLIFFGVRAIIQNFKVEGASMEPNLQTGQYLLINKAAYYHVEGFLANVLPSSTQGTIHYLFGGPERGDIAVFQAPPQPDKDFIKRVIGLPGDMVLVTAGKVYVNGKLLDEPYLEFHATYNYPASQQPLRVPDDSYFVLGDNRPNSSDSHTGWFVPVDHLIGRAWASYWPPTDWGFIPHATYAAG